MNDPVVGAKNLLVAANVATFSATAEPTTGWGISYGQPFLNYPKCITLATPGGQDPFPHLALNFPNLQVLIRGAPRMYVETSAKAREVQTALLGLVAQEVNSEKWYSITQQGDCNWLGFDENSHPIWSLNFRLIIEPAASGNRVAIT